MKTKIRMILWVLLMVALSSPVTADIDLTELVKSIQPAVATVVVYDVNSNVANLGTGFFIDKTGTLTKGEFGATDVIFFNNEYDEKEILKYAATIESESEHPIALGIVKSSENKYDLKDFNSMPGKGAEGKVNNKEVKIVSPGYLEENNIELKENEKIEKLSSQGKTVVFVLIDNDLTGAIALADIIREESKEAIKQLHVPA